MMGPSVTELNIYWKCLQNKLPAAPDCEEELSGSSIVSCGDFEQQRQKITVCYIHVLKEVNMLCVLVHLSFSRFTSEKSLFPLQIMSQSLLEVVSENGNID